MARVRKIDWLNHSLEFLVVVVGILIAFQLNTCSEEKKEAQIVQRHTNNIIAETKFNRNNIERTLTQCENLKAKIDTLLIEVTLGQNVEKINSLSLEALQLNNAYYKQNAYNAMVETGDMRLYEDVELRDDIISLYEYYAWAKGIDEATLETYTTYYYPYAVENFDLINGEPQAIEKYNNRKFSNILAGYSYMMKFRIEKQKELLEKTTEFLDKYDHSSD